MMAKDILLNIKLMFFIPIKNIEDFYSNIKKKFNFKSFDNFYKNLNRFLFREYNGKNF